MLLMYVRDYTSVMSMTKLLCPRIGNGLTVSPGHRPQHVPCQGDRVPYDLNRLFADRVLQMPPDMAVLGSPPGDTTGWSAVQACLLKNCRRSIIQLRSIAGCADGAGTTRGHRGDSDH
jgi:hypothetical protein